ncbi:PREDICTED: nascent polypeptide-associated complex subunit alpha, muscle-specific form-like [Lipotes vexillifer]|uniref:Nascent polypeptide-associated complex subunit alpha, muscle-specific form-like n=1 Tax=Lipotes vexillifer TaxID=118797 RepID=A0A340X5Z7_LIPVE|nr:PREDICTED: nascent polypeptide-associated complex subunit alpha, muscle-specific form-like [Lipotes vexillifer]
MAIMPQIRPSPARWTPTLVLLPLHPSGGSVLPSGRPPPAWPPPGRLAVFAAGILPRPGHQATPGPPRAPVLSVVLTRLPGLSPAVPTWSPQWGAPGPAGSAGSRVSPGRTPGPATSPRPRLPSWPLRRDRVVEGGLLQIWMEERVEPRHRCVWP